MLFRSVEDLAPCWEHISPQLMFLDVTFPNRLKEMAIRAGHLCPGLLEEELISFRRSKAYLPRIVLIHLNPQYEDEIRNEATKVAEKLGAEIDLAHEGMEIEF